MLVLSRKISESIQIGNDITITVTQIAGGEVKLGIEAPSHVRILRGELTKTSVAIPVSVATAAVAIHQVEVANTEESDCSIDEQSPLDFSTEYAAQLEDQLRCVMAV